MELAYMDLSKTYEGRKILITGGVGTVGRALIDQTLQYDPKEIRVLDNNETGLFMLSEEFNGSSKVNVFLGSVRDPIKMESVLRGVDVVFHAAAFKHVILSEYNPFEAVRTNIMGVQNIIQYSIRAGVELVVFTSSDKAANPTSVMGTSKLMGERLMTAANILNQGQKQIFTSTRFGNVLGSHGSVVPLFAKQIAGGGPVTLTDPRMTRFIMTTKQAAQLILNSGAQAHGGEVFVSKMPAARIVDLCEVMIERLAPAYGYDPGQIEIKTIGAKPGEKLFEELMTEDESRHSMELPETMVTIPVFRSIYREINYEYQGARPAEVKPYISAEATCLDKEELSAFFDTHKVLDEYLNTQA
jgi:FlaA1/EpsC-like NDP-sugar epimerase